MTMSGGEMAAMRGMIPVLGARRPEAYAVPFTSLAR